MKEEIKKLIDSVIPYHEVITLVEKTTYEDEYGEVVIPIGTKGAVCEKYEDGGCDVDFEVNDVLGPGHDFDYFAMVPYYPGEVKGTDNCLKSEK